MGLGERCDEIVRLIDETLAAFGVDPGDTTANPPAPATTVTPFPARRARRGMPAAGF